MFFSDQCDGGASDSATPHRICRGGRRFKLSNDEAKASDKMTYWPMGNSLLVEIRLSKGATLDFDATGLIGFISCSSGALKIDAHAQTQSISASNVLLFGAHDKYEVSIEDDFKGSGFLTEQRSFWRCVHANYATAGGGFDDAAAARTEPKVTALIKLMRYFINENRFEDSAPFSQASQRIIEETMALRVYESLRTAFKTEKTDTTDTSDHKHKPDYVRAAERYMRNHFPDITSIKEIAEEVEVSTRTLSRGFQAFNGVRPVEYLRIVRLNAARRALLDPTDLRSTGAIAKAAGFKTYAGFWRHYSRHFSESPSDTRARATHTKL